MVQQDYAPLWAMSLGVVVPLVAVVGVCICGCRKTVPKNDLHGLPGMVKITNPDEELNHQPTNEIPGYNAVGTTATSVETSDMNRRSSATVNRSLPAIPNDSERLRPAGDAIWENEPNGDTSSELYATVGDKQIDKQATVPLVGLHSATDERRPNSVDTAHDKNKNMKPHSSNEVDESEHYDCLKSDHPYDRVRKSEHPYAQVKAADASGPSSQDLVHSSIHDISEGAAAGAGASPGAARHNPVPPPRARRATPAAGGGGGAGGEEGGGAGATAAAERAAGIAAATAIAGRVAASQELPYMTPPIAASSTAHFSGDSQDSKGYTSISVREPLATIKAQTKVYGQRHPAEMQDSHYATVSDDSDEMYAAIEEPINTYNSGSETYAQIQPSGGIEPIFDDSNSENLIYPPQPPSVDSLKHVAHAHSRQASSSSASSSVVNLGSPKPEKRQANSPLPPPPSASGGSDKNGDKQNLTVASDVLNLDEMYAKVMKKKHNTESDAVSNASQAEVASSSQNVGELQNHLSPHQEQTRSYYDNDQFSVSRNYSSCTKSDNLTNEHMKHKGELQTHLLGLVDSDSVLEPFRKSNKSQEYLDPGYEVVHPHACADKATVSEINTNRPVGEDKCSSPSSDSSTFNNNSNESSSAQSHRGERNDSNNNSNTDEDCYSKYSNVLPVAFAVGAGRNNHRYFGDDISEPNYESMPSEEITSAQGTSRSSETDPNYEVVEHDDPNYESVSYIETNSDPPYERLHNEIRDLETDTDHNYEHARHCNSAIAEQSGKIGSNNFTESEFQTSEPGYEEIGQQQNKDWRKMDSSGRERRPSVS